MTRQPTIPHASKRFIHACRKDTLNGSLASERNQTTFLGEIGVVARYALTRHVAFRASAQAAYLDGVALAPEQIVATDFALGTARVDTGGSVLYYGGGLGCEFRY